MSNKKKIENYAELIDTIKKNGDYYKIIDILTNEVQLLNNLENYKKELKKNGIKYSKHGTDFNFFQCMISHTLKSLGHLTKRGGNEAKLASQLWKEKKIKMVCRKVWSEKITTQSPPQQKLVNYNNEQEYSTTAELPLYEILSQMEIKDLELPNRNLKLKLTYHIKETTIHQNHREYPLFIKQTLTTGVFVTKKDVKITDIHQRITELSYSSPLLEKTYEKGSYIDQHIKSICTNLDIKYFGKYLGINDKQIEKSKFEGLRDEKLPESINHNAPLPVKVKRLNDKITYNYGLLRAHIIEEKNKEYMENISKEFISRIFYLISKKAFTEYVKSDARRDYTNPDDQICANTLTFLVYKLKSSDW